MNKKVRCIDAEPISNIQNGKIYEVESEYINPLSGEKFYYLAGNNGIKFQSRFEDVVEPKQEVKPEPKYPIIERFGTYKVVFNPPYTIVQAYIFGEPYFKGKAKCNPKDAFDKWEGFKIAMSRLEQI